MAKPRPMSENHSFPLMDQPRKLRDIGRGESRRTLP
jgi:hypothetical protein